MNRWVRFRVMHAGRRQFSTSAQKRRPISQNAASFFSDAVLKNKTPRHTNPKNCWRLTFDFCSRCLIPNVIQPRNSSRLQGNRFFSETRSSTFLLNCNIVVQREVVTHINNLVRVFLFFGFISIFRIDVLGFLCKTQLTGLLKMGYLKVYSG